MATPKTAPAPAPDKDAKKTYRLPDGKMVTWDEYADWLAGNLVKSQNLPNAE